MTEREALKLALEALEEAADAIDSWGSYASGYFQVKHDLENDISKAKGAITAIKEALSSCQCPECKEVLHASDCAVHNEPAYPKGECNCGAQPEQEPVKYDCCGNCMRPQHEHNGNSCPKPYTTVWHAWDYDFSPYPAPAVNPSQQAIHCKHRRENSGVCPHHNLQCGWPKCNAPEQEPVATDWERIARVQDAKLRAMCNEAGGFEKLCEVMDKYERITPPQRKPLTPSQVQKIWKESGYDEALMEERAHFINGIRHAEVAHGIKE